MEEICSSETLDCLRTTRLYNTHIHRLENIKSTFRHYFYYSFPVASLCLRKFFLVCVIIIIINLLNSESSAEVKNRGAIYTFTSPITVVARCKARTVFAHSNTGIVDSNPTGGMDICVRLFCVFVVLCVGRGLATCWSPVQGVIPIVYRLRHWKNGQGPQWL
jgi:hypothetical protein